MAFATPERMTNRCPLCDDEIWPDRPHSNTDAPCPNCGHLVWWVAGTVRAVLYPVAGSHEGDAPARPGVVILFADRALQDPDSIQALFGRLGRIAHVPVRRDLVLDFRNVGYLSSSVLGKLIALRRNLHVHRNDLRLVNVGPELSDAFRVTRLDKLFALEPVEQLRPARL